MADSATTTASPSSAEPAPAPGWSQLWQMPVLVLGLLLLGVWFALTLRDPREKNDFSGSLDSVAQFIKANNFEDARGRINQILPHTAKASPAENGRLKQLWGDLIFLEQRSANLDVAENHKKIIELYTEARTLGQPFDPQHLQWWARTQVAMGQEEAALKTIDQLKDQPAEWRYVVVREILEHRCKASGVTMQTLTPLIDRFRAELRTEEPAKRRQQELWLTGLQARMMLEGGEVDRAIDDLLRRINTLAGAADEGDLAPLMVLLAQAYQRAGENAKARAWYQRAQAKLASADALQAEILVGLGQLELADSNDVQAALEYFSAALSQQSAIHPAYFDALLGRGDCEARLGSQTEAVDHFGKAVRYLLDHPRERDERQKQLVNTVHSHFDAANEREDFEQALEYISLLSPLYQKQTELPAKLLSELAVTHEKIAIQLQQGTPATQPSHAAGKKPADKAAAQQAAIHLAKAAGYYVRHAHAVALADESAYGLSLWKAAECFDKAQLWKSAIDVYAEFVKSRAGDPRQLSALLQLGLAYQADGQLLPAIDRFKQIIDTQPRSPEAYAALVPLAQCYITSNDPESAKRVLAYAIKDHPTITPDSQVYRDSLIEMGKLHYKLGEYKQAIERLQLAVDRYKDAPGAAEIRYRLADAYRRSVEEIEKELLEPMPQSRKLALQAERARRLDQAQILFSQVISELDSGGEASHSPVEALFCRNAYFYRADCAYDLRRFEQAIQLYDLAAKRFETHPAALVALVQIVNAYCELGRIQEAKVANLRARSLLKRLPEEAFNDPSLPMSRAHWEDWLRWTSELDLFKSNTTQASAATEP